MAPTTLYALYEHSTGYALFKVKEFEEIGQIQPQVNDSIYDLSKFNSIVSLAAFTPFANGAFALENLIGISEGDVHPDLKNFLEANVPASSKKMKIILGVNDAKLGGAISELKITCLATGVVPNLMRGIRCHFGKLVKGMAGVNINMSQLGLAHSYGNTKIKFNVNKADNNIIQSVNLIDQMEKNVNTIAMRVRESNAYHFPELAKIIPDNSLYLKAVVIIDDRSDLNETKIAQLEELLMDSSKVEMIKAAAKSSMGMQTSPMDLSFITMMAKFNSGHIDYKVTQQDYLREKMNTIAPNLSTLVGEQVGAKLISKAGSLTNLSKFAASTIQILGAEKALFRALKTRTNTPKYGLLYHAGAISKAPLKQKGRISRMLANKCSIASRIDCYTENPTSIFGEMMKEQIEERLKFYEGGEVPQKNEEVMKAALEKVAKQTKKMEKKKRKQSLAVDDEAAIDGSDGVSKKRKVEPNVEDAAEVERNDATEVVAKKKKKTKQEPEPEAMDVSVEEVRSEKKKKKKHSVQNEEAETNHVEEPTEGKKKKKKLSLDVEQTEEVEKPKKKKKRTSLPEC